MNNSVKTFRYDIQGLRAIAVLLVFIFHLTPHILPGGFVGVDVFFVISGFLVGGVILSKKKKNNFSFLDFYIGRIKRIIPVFLLLLIFVAVVGSFVYLSSDLSFLRRILFHSVIFNSNNYFASLDSYFGASSLENALLHTWTLAIEMQFYVILPLLLICINEKYLFKVLLLLFCVLVTYSIINAFYYNEIQSMYFSLPARMPEFLLGVIFALKKDTIQLKTLKYKNLVSISSVLGILISAFLFNEHTVFPGILVFIPVICTGMLLLTEKSVVNNFISNNFFVFVGELSYSIYLWHWSIMAFVRYYINDVNFNIQQMLLIIIVTFLLSYVSYTLIENKYRKFSTKKFVLYFVPLLILLGVSVFSIFKMSYYFSNIPVEFSKPTFGLVSHGKTYQNVQVLGDQYSDNKICLLGDSHALSYKGFLDYIGGKNQFGVKTITNDRYPTLPYLKPEDFEKKVYLEQYQALIKEAQKLITESDVIIISSVWMIKIPSLADAFGRMIKELRPEQKVLILEDFPSFKKNPIKIVRGYKREDGKVYDFGVKKTNSLPNYVNNIVKNNSKVYKFSLDQKHFFSELPFIDDKIAYYDQGHLNFYGSKKFAEFYEKDFMQFMIKNNLLNLE